jgi:hypothetical protein
MVKSILNAADSPDLYLSRYRIPAEEKKKRNNPVLLEAKGKV